MTLSHLLLILTMAFKANFLTIPMELRRQVYNLLFVNDSVLNIARNLVDRPLHGLIRSCRQLYFETLDYYYANNTFLLSLLRPPEATPKLLRHLSYVQHLQLEIGDLTLSLPLRIFCLPLHTQRRYDWFLKTLRQAKRGQEGQLLKTLVAIDRCGNSIVSA